MHERTRNQINGNCLQLRRVSKVRELLHLLGFACLPRLAAWLGAPKAASTLISDLSESLSPEALNSRASAQHSKPKTLVTNASFLTTRSTSVYVVAAGSEFHGVAQRLTKQKAYQLTQPDPPLALLPLGRNSHTDAHAGGDGHDTLHTTTRSPLRPRHFRCLSSALADKAPWPVART